MYYNEELFNSLDLAFKESFITGLMDVIGNGMKVVGGGFKHEEVIFSKKNLPAVYSDWGRFIFIS